MLAPALAIGLPALIGAIFFIWSKRRVDNPNGPIVVVDRRTLHLARSRVTTAHAAGDTARALAGLTAISLWLAGEIHTGPRRYRAEYATLKAEVDATKNRYMASFAVTDPQ